MGQQISQIQGKNQEVLPQLTSNQCQLYLPSDKLHRNVCCFKNKQI